jgi:hypothetical protein
MMVGGERVRLAADHRMITKRPTRRTPAASHRTK